MRMRAVALIVLALAVGAHDARAQDSTSTSPWSWSASLWLYVVPDDPNYLQPTVAADHDWLHLEGRYNYEALETASFWAGYNIEAGSKLTMLLTPMVGGVVGDITGVAPGYELTLDWWKLELYSEGEYVVDFDDSSENFFYNWSQLGISPVDWLELGIAAQRTRAYQSDRDIQRGLFAGVTWKCLNLSTYFFNPDDESPTWILTLTYTH